MEIFKRLIHAIRLIHQDADLKDVNISVGLSNFTVMLPSKTCRRFTCPKVHWKVLFLTMAMPMGLNTVIGFSQKKYSLLPEDHPAMPMLKRCFWTWKSFDSIIESDEFLFLNYFYRVSFNAIGFCYIRKTSHITARAETLPLHAVF